jgi:hypothetical protein
MSVAELVQLAKQSGIGPATPHLQESDLASARQNAAMVANVDRRIDAAGNEGGKKTAVPAAGPSKGVVREIVHTKQARGALWKVFIRYGNEADKTITNAQFQQLMKNQRLNDQPPLDLKSDGKVR